MGGPWRECTDCTVIRKPAGTSKLNRHNSNSATTAQDPPHNGTTELSPLELMTKEMNNGDGEDEAYK